VGLVIQIALGIVLAWFLITRFETIINIIFYPFRLVWKIIKAIGVGIYEVLRVLVSEFGELIFYFLSIAFIGAIVVGLFLAVPVFIAEPYTKYGYIALIGLGLAIALLTILKDAIESYKDKSPYYWMFLITFIFFIVLLVLRFFFF